MTQKPQTLIEIDARDLRCPLPVLRLQKALRGVDIGAVIALQATDGMAQIDVPHFCATQGHHLISVTQRDGVLHFVIEKGSGAMKKPSAPVDPN